MHELIAVFVNAGKSINSKVKTRVLLEAIEHLEPQWGLCFVSESDAVNDTQFSAAGKSTHLHLRSPKPVGGWAMSLAMERKGRVLTPGGI